MHGMTYVHVELDSTLSKNVEWHIYMHNATLSYVWHDLTQKLKAPVELDYRVAKINGMPYLYRLFPAKEPHE